MSAPTPERERRDGDERKAGRAAQAAERVSKILSEVVHEIASPFDTGDGVIMRAERRVDRVIVAEALARGALSLVA
ncbi:MAG TPA: hypothetical protein VH559_08880 [Gemmatimonadaceae bacterium]